MSWLWSLETLTFGDALLRVLLACIFGFFVGFDRNRKNKPVDFRVYMIVAATTCLVAIMGPELIAQHSKVHENAELDLMRVVEGVLTGMGFLGAGAILKSSDQQRVIGTATGASIWASGLIGLMLGFGYYALAMLGFLVLAVILVVFGFLRKPLFNETDMNGSC